jgi:hypothetical protein
MVFEPLDVLKFDRIRHMVSLSLPPILPAYLLETGIHKEISLAFATPEYVAVFESY